jgi:hypothetical protein
LNLPPGFTVNVPAKADETGVPLDTKYRVRIAQVAVGNLGESIEAEPNDAPAQPPLALPATISGRIDAAGVTTFRFENRRPGVDRETDAAAAHQSIPSSVLTPTASRSSHVCKRCATRRSPSAASTAIPALPAHQWEEMQLNQWVYLNGECSNCSLAARPTQAFSFTRGTAANGCAIRHDRHGPRH